MLLKTRWRSPCAGMRARSRYEQLLVQLEGQERYEGLQSFLEVVHRLAVEQRLSRFVYLAVKRA
jgi:hypothetical protein